MTNETLIPDKELRARLRTALNQAAAIIEVLTFRGWTVEADIRSVTNDRGGEEYYGYSNVSRKETLT